MKMIDVLWFFLGLAMVGFFIGTWGLAPLLGGMGLTALWLLVGAIFVDVDLEIEQAELWEDDDA